MQNFDLRHFINKFEGTPYEKWCVMHLQNANGQSCVFGLCGTVYSSAGYKFTDEGEAFKAIVKKYNPAIFIYDVNDGSLWSVYKQDNPKDRILALTYDIRDKQLEEANLKAALELVNEDNKVEVI